MQTKRSTALPVSLKYTAEFLKAFDRVGSILCGREEAFTLYSALKATEVVAGDIAEVGVYRGKSAQFICEVKGDRAFILCDTFCGMPDHLMVPHVDHWPINTHQSISCDEVRTRLSGYTNVHFIQGVFPECLSEAEYAHMERRQFSFVHLDVDLYRSTIDALSFFWPRLLLGGRIVSHNFNDATREEGGIYDGRGIRTAFHEFFRDETYRIVEIADTQCLVIKT